MSGGATVAAGQLSAAGIGEGVARASPCRLSAIGDAIQVEGTGWQRLKLRCQTKGDHRAGFARETRDRLTATWTGV